MKEKTDGDCFVVAANIVSCYGMGALAGDAGHAGIKTLQAMHIKEDDLRLVHGLVTRRPDGRRHCHAWVEIESMRLAAEFLR